MLKKKYMNKLLFFCIIIVSFSSCKNGKSNSNQKIQPKNSIQYAKGLSIVKHENFTLVTVNNPWPNAEKMFTYVLYKKGFDIPDSLKNYTSLQVPIHKIVVTSTTHIPALELLGQENTLIGFPNLKYISSEKTRALIDAGKVREIGTNQDLNTEVLIDLQPEVIVGFGVDNDKKTFANLEKSGLKVLYNGDWTEETPLGKAEWIKFFGVLYDKQEEAHAIFQNIEKEYLNVKELAEKETLQPTILSGAIYENQWYLPQGKSWAALFLKEANGNYLWKDSEGTGSLALSFETVLEKGKDADVWIGPGQFTSIVELLSENGNYKFFKSVQNKNIYSYSSKKGKTGGVIYYELAASRPDLVLKDLVKILHPNLLPEYELYFFEKLH